MAYSYYNSGMTVRMDQYRLTQYFKTKDRPVDMGDHPTDALGNHNIAAQHPEIVKQFTEILEKRNTGLFR